MVDVVPVTAANKDLKDVSDELTARWNGPE